MTIYVKKLDWSRCEGVPTPVNKDVAEEVLNYLFNTSTWKQHPDHLILRVRKWRERLWAGAEGVPQQAPTVITPAPAVAVEEDGPAVAPTEGELWSDVAVRMRAEGASWNEIARATGKAIGTVRDAIKRAQKLEAA